MKKNTLHSGFTVIELLLYMGIFSILLFVLFDLFTMILSTHAESQSTSSIDQDAGFIMNRLSYDIHRGNSLNPNTPGTTGTTLEVTGTGEDEVYSIDGNNNLILTDKSLIPNTSLPLNSVNTKVISISFTTLGNTGPNAKLSAKISFTLQSTIKTNQTRLFQTTIQTR